MGKFVIQYLIPMMVLLPLVWLGIRRLYVKMYGRQVDEQLQVRKATDEYNQRLGINQPKEEDHE